MLWILLGKNTAWWNKFSSFIPSLKVLNDSNSFVDYSLTVTELYILAYLSRCKCGRQHCFHSLALSSRLDKLWSVQNDRIHEPSTILSEIQREFLYQNTLSLLQNGFRANYWRWALYCELQCRSFRVASASVWRLQFLVLVAVHWRRCQSRLLWTTNDESHPRNSRNRWLELPFPRTRHCTVLRVTVKEVFLKLALPVCGQLVGWAWPQNNWRVRILRMRKRDRHTQSSWAWWRRDQ